MASSEKRESRVRSPSGASSEKRKRHEESPSVVSSEKRESRVCSLSGASSGKREKRVASPSLASSEEESRAFAVKCVTRLASSDYVLHNRTYVRERENESSFDESRFIRKCQVFFFHR